MAIFDAEEVDDKKAKWSDVFSTVLGCLGYLVFSLAGITLIVLVITGAPWIFENVYPIVALVSGLLLLVLVPISIPLSIIKKTRPWGGLGFYISSYVLGLSLWLWCLILAYLMAGTIWTIVGLFFFGVGVVFVAFVASLLHAEWSVAIQIAISTVVVYGFRVLGTYLIEGKKEGLSESEDFDEFWAEQERKKQIVSRFGRFMEDQEALIPDIKTLPYSKQEIHDALFETEQEMCDLANQAVKDGKTEKLPELEKLIGALGSCRVVLHTYCDIDPDDQADVDYFNSYSGMDEIPPDEKPEFVMLFAKYASKGMELPAMDEGS